MDRDENENLLCEYDLSSDDEKRKGSSVSSEEATTEKFRQHDYNNFEPSHPWISIFIAFLAFAVDAMLFTVVDPILPDMLRQIDLQPDRWVSNAWLTQAEPLVHSNETEALQTKNSVKIAVMIGMKPLLEMAFNICIGFLIERIGYRAPMLVGSAFNMGATLSFAYLRNYYLLIIARAMQALAGSLSVVGALSFLAATFREDKARMKATSIAFTGLSVGLTGGYVMGSFLYQFCATECPYLIIAGICLVDSTFRILFVTSKPSSEGKKVKASLSDSAISLLKDPLVLAGLAINFIQKVCLGVYLSTGPSWILYSLHGEQWILGVLFGCGTLVMLTSQLATSRLAQVHTMWKPVFLSLLLLSAGVAMYPLCTSPWQVLVPDLTGRVGHGILVAALNPMLHHIVDMRHNSQYGILNGFYTATLNLGLGFGPNAAGVLLKVIPFKWLYWGLASIVLGMSSLALYWRNLDSHKQSTTQCKLV